MTGQYRLKAFLDPEFIITMGIDKAREMFKADVERV